MKKNSYDFLPVIIGTSISGMAISKKLSSNKIEHVLIGEPVKEKRPILGESVEMFGTKILTDLFPQQQKHYYPKLGINYHLDNSICHFDFRRSFALPEVIELMERTKYTYTAEGCYSLIHIDRALFDAEIFQEVVSSPYCCFINDRVKKVDYNKSEDVVDKLYLENSGVIIPSYVYDGSNALRVLATMLDIEVSYLTKPMRLVFTHYQANESNKDKLNGTATPWYVFTNIYRHYQATSGFEGSSWCIPIGDHISIGTNINEDCDLTNEEILEITKKSYHGRGVTYGDIYNIPTKISSFSGPLYYCKKVFGKNWILASGAAALTWYTAQTGVESAMFVANIAKQLLKFPIQYGQYFQDFIERQVKMHQVHDWLHFHVKDKIVEKEAYHYMINSIRNIQSRYFLGMLTLDHNFLDKIEWIADIENYCKDLSADEMNDIIACVKRGETSAEYIELM